MLEALAIVALRIRPAAPFLAGTAAVLLAAAAALVVMDPTGRANTWLTLIVILLLWCLCGWVFIRVFATLPPPPSADLRGLPLLAAWLNRAFHWLLALVFGVTTAAAIMLTLRLLGDSSS